jgi:type II secretory pathway pseudopilin PulG
MNIRRRGGFTPLELIVVLAILLLGLAFFAPLMARLRGSASQAQSMNNIKQLTLGTINLADTYRGKLPAAAGAFFPARPENTGTVHYYILPYIEQQPLFNKAGGFEGSPWQDNVAATPLGLFVDPADTSAPPSFAFKGWLATTNYPCNWMVFKDGTNRYPASITDGTSNTLMFAQRSQMCNGEPTAWGYADTYFWTPMFAYYSTDKFQSAPSPDNCDPRRPQSVGRAAILIGFCDGSAHAIRPEISAATWYALCTPSNGDIFNLDDL